MIKGKSAFHDHGVTYGSRNAELGNVLCIGRTAMADINLSPRVSPRQYIEHDTQFEWVYQQFETRWYVTRHVSSDDRYLGITCCYSQWTLIMYYIQM